MKLLSQILIIVIFLTNSFSFAQEKKEQINLIIIYNYDGPAKFSALGRKVIPLINQTASTFRNINILERELEDIKNEVKLSMAGFTQNEIEIGKALHADYILTINVQINFLDAMIGIEDYTFTIEGKWANIVTTEVKRIYESGQFDTAEDEDTHPFNLATTNFAYATMDLIIENLDIQESDLRRFIEKEEKDYRSIKFKGFRNAGLWGVSGLLAGWVGYSMQRNGKPWYAYSGLYLLSGAFLYSSGGNIVNMNKVTGDIHKRIEKHKKIYATKFGKSL